MSTNGNDALIPATGRRPVEQIQPDLSPSFYNTSETGIESNVYLRTYWKTLFKRRWTVATAALLVSTVAAIISFKAVPVYEAVAQVDIEDDAPEVQILGDLSRTMTAANDDLFLQTQVRVIESAGLAWQVIGQLGLSHSPEFAIPPENGRVLPTAAKQVLLVQNFKRHLRVQLIRDTRMVEIGFQSHNPELAARAANTLVSTYVEYNFRKKYDATRQASGWMEQQLDELKAKVEKSQQALVDYERQYSIVSTSDKQNIEEQRLSDLTRDLTDAQNVRLQKESLYELVQGNESRVSFITQNDLLQRLEEKYADLKTSYVEALAQYGPNFPQVMRMREQLKESQSLVEQERKKVVSRIRSEYQAAQSREAMLAREIIQQKAKVGALNQLLIQHNILQRDYETNQRLYDNLLQRLKNATVSAGLRATNVHQIDVALPPNGPIRPRKARDTALGLLVGLILGVTMAFVKEALDNSIKTTDEVELLTSAPVLATIPLFQSVAFAKPALERGLAGNGNRNGRVELMVFSHPSSPVAEAFRVLRTSVLLSTASHPPQVLLITSPCPTEGKSCTAMNLALALAQQGSRVLIVDADLRKPSVGELIKIGDGKGLSGVLTGAHPLEEVLRVFESVPNLWAIPAGPLPPNPAELLSSKAMEKMISEVRQNFDHIVLDSPPVLLVTDATVLSRLADGVILVAQSQATPRDGLLRARRVLENAGGRILGVALNKVSIHHDGYYTGYYDGYYRYYGSHTSART